MGRVSEPFVSEILDACALGRGQRLLDVGTGTGLVAAAAAARESLDAVVGHFVSSSVIGPSRPSWRSIKTALICGVSGQDGAYLAKLLVESWTRATTAVRAASERGRARR
jgi:hypothetical protein